ncbi:MAG: hypothetical protein U0175_22045 [Caldilineaceae bacterium]
MEYFDVGDADLFFGREQLTAELVELYATVRCWQLSVPRAVANRRWHGQA